MSPLRTNAHRYFTRGLHLILIFILTLLTACQVVFPPAAETPAPDQLAVEYSRAEVTFVAHLPQALAEGQGLFVEILDEVTGLALNTARLRMESEDGVTYTARAPFVVGSVIKYRYVRDNDPAGVEYNTLNQQVRYRMFVVHGTSQVDDYISGWKSQPAGSRLGRIHGQVAYRESKSPLVNALVVAGGLSTLTASDGSFVLEGLIPGTHNIVVYSMDGTFQPFQQGAVIEPDATTPALILVNQAETVNVTFVVHPPAGSPDGLPIRMVGNIASLGNTFADLRGGVSVLASRAPLMSVQEDGSYKLTLQLPVGLDLQYKYTLGDGFWNAERGSNGEVRLRRLIVPDRDFTVDDSIATWKTSGYEPISFNVTVPADTPATDTISIQFNPYGWTEPIPMWPLGNNRWFYVLYNPLKVINEGTYRFCRNEQCGTADAIDTAGVSAQGKVFRPQQEAQTIDETITSWAYYEAASGPVVVPAVEINSRDAGFMAAVEFIPYYHPSRQPYTVWAVQNLKDIGANTVILSSAWQVTHQNPPVMSLVPGKNALWNDLTQAAQLAQQQGLGIVIHPTLNYDQDPSDWWETADRDEGWWQSWFDRYATFVLYHADLATQTGAQALILGDEYVPPALSGGGMDSESTSDMPESLALEWEKLIDAVRMRYKGNLVWMLPHSGSLAAQPDFINRFDMLYVQISPPLVSSDAASLAELEARFDDILDNTIEPLQQSTRKPVIIGLRHPSAEGAIDGCVEAGEGCRPIEFFLGPSPDASPALQEQADVYSAALSAVNQRSWVSGFVAAGYDPAVGLKDASISVRSKPAADVLWFWFPRLTGQISN